MLNRFIIKPLIFLIGIVQSAFGQIAEEDKWGYHKILPYHHEEEVLEVLKHYPELKTTFIVFKYKKLSNAIMQAQPTIGSLIFRSKNRRRYKILINVLPSPDLALEDMPRNVIKGIIAHELAHIAYYTQRSNVQLILDFMRYPINCPFKKEFERNTDIIAIQHGLGDILKEAWQYLGFDAPLPDAFKAQKRFYYLSPLEIDKQMKKLGKAGL